MKSHKKANELPPLNYDTVKGEGYRIYPPCIHHRGGGGLHRNNVLYKVLYPPLLLFVYYANRILVLFVHRPSRQLPKIV